MGDNTLSLILAIIAGLIVAILLFLYNKILKAFGFGKDEDIEILKKEMNIKLDQLKDIIETKIPPQIDIKLINQVIRKEQGELKVVDNKPSLNADMNDVVEKATLLVGINSILMLKYLKLEARSGYISFILEKFHANIEKGDFESFVKNEATAGKENGINERKWLAIFRKLDELGFVEGILNPFLVQLMGAEINTNIINQFTEMCEKIDEKGNFKFEIGKEKVAIIRIGNKQKVKKYDKISGYPYKNSLTKFKTEGFNTMFLLPIYNNNEVTKLLAELLLEAFNDSKLKTYNVNMNYKGFNGVVQIIHISKK
ncbi:MAG: hypothetical protein KGJ87_09170 [Planctomycetota bacterium]|nr:hypothetical protein [Planctomycetota bacterium]